MAITLVGLTAAGCSTSTPAKHSSPGDKPGASGAKANARATTPSSDEQVLPVEGIAHFATGLLHELEGDPDQALAEYSASALANPEYEPVVVESVRRHLRTRQPEKAIEILVKATSSQSASGTLFAWLGLAYGQSGQKDLAIRANRTAIKKLPRSLPAYQNLAQLYFQSGQTNEALRVLDGAAQQPSVDAPFLIDLADIYARYYRAQNSTNDSTKARAVELLDRAGQFNSPNPTTLQKLGDGYLQLAEFDKAEAAYQQLLKSLPQMSLLRGKLADLYIRAGKKEKAMEQLEALSREDPTNPRTHAVLGSLALEANKVDAAIRYFEQALLMSPQMEQVYYELAGAKIINQRKPDEALALLEKARARFKPSFPMEYYSALALLEMKRFPDAVRCLTSAELIAKASEPARLSQFFYYQMGSACERNGDIEQAEKHFLKCLELAPDFADAMNYMGYMWAVQGKKLEQAHVLILRAVELEPNNAAFLDSLGWVLYRLNRPREALTYIHRAVEKSDALDPTLLDHLGDIFASLQETRQARESWSQALSVEDVRESARKSLSAEEYKAIKEKLEAAPSSERRLSSR